MNKITSLILLLAASTLAACSHKETPYGQRDNIKEFGVIVSQAITTDTNVGGIAKTATGTALQGASGAASGTGMISGMTSSFSSMFTGMSSVQTQDTTDITNIKYVIDKDNGQRITIIQQPAENDPILYAGEHVIIQTNGDYTRIYPADVENRRNQ